MVQLNSSLLIRTNYSSVRDFVLEHKSRFIREAVQSAVQIDRIVEIQSDYKVSQVALGALSQRLTTLLQAFVSDVNVQEDSVEYAQKRAQIIQLVHTILGELSGVLKNLQIEASQVGDEAVLGDPGIANRILGYLGQPYNDADSLEVVLADDFNHDNPGAYYLETLKAQRPTEYL